MKDVILCHDCLTDIYKIESYTGVIPSVHCEECGKLDWGYYVMGVAKRPKLFPSPQRAENS